MPHQPAFERDHDAAKNQRPAFHQPVQVVADACASRSRGRPTANHRLGDRQIVRRRDLDVRHLAFDDPNRVSGQLGQRRFVGGVRVQRERVAKHVAPEGLRCLCEVDRFADQRAPYVGSGFSRTGLLHRVPRLYRRHSCSALHRRCNRTSDEISARKGPCGVMDHDEVARLISRGERIGHRVLPARAAGDDPERLRRVAEVLRWIIGQSLRQRDDDFVHARMREKRGEAALEDRAAADLQQLLRLLAAEPLTASSRGDDGCHMHNRVAA